MTESPNPYRLTNDVSPVAYRIHLAPDLAAATFTGSVEIDLDLAAPTSTITLNAIELQLETARVTAQGRTLVSAPARCDTTYETASFDFPEAIPAGPATLALEFTGVLNDQLHGFYRSTYTDPDGVAHTIATTQFESSDARRAFPCFDEPAKKATYQVSLRIPSDLAAYSNTAEVSRTTHEDATTTVVFAPTMKMSTYLVAFVVGPFEATEPVDVDGVPLRAIYPRGKGHLVAWPLEVAEHALRFFAEYFAIPYPGDKFDLIAIPDFAAGAMENLGLVTFREVDMLIDPDRATPDQIQRVTMVVNHETAHMWFGDLVTMEWWEGIWLNEAFATFMESICTDHFRPQWKKWVGFGREKDYAMSVDSLHATRPIEYEVVSPADCRGMFDVLTYIKGCSVLRMLEQYLGAETFRDGIRIYLKRHQYANARTADLWRALEESSGQPVGAIMDTWILQGGFPLISVDGGRITQGPFYFSPAEGPSAIGEAWQVPVLSRPLAGGPTSRQLLMGPSDNVATPGVAIINAGGSGFFRVAYGPDDLRAISEGLGSLDEIERSALFSDTWAAALAGRAGATDVVTLAGGLGELDEPASWTVVQQCLRTLDRIVDAAGRRALAEVTRRLARPQLERLGFDRRDGDSDQTRTLRGIIVDTLGTIGQDDEVIAEALRRFDSGDVVGDLFDAILLVVARQARPQDEAAFEERRRSARTPQEENAYLYAETQVPDLARSMRLLARCFGEIRNQDAPYIVARMLANPVTGPDVWRAYVKRLDEAEELFPVGSVGGSFTTLSMMIGDRALAREIRDFHASHPLPVAQRQVDQALERMDVGVAFAERIRSSLGDDIGRLLA